MICLLDYVVDLLAYMRTSIRSIPNIMGVGQNDAVGELMFWAFPGSNGSRNLSVGCDNKPFSKLCDLRLDDFANSVQNRVEYVVPFTTRQHPNSTHRSRQFVRNSHLIMRCTHPVSMRNAWSLTGSSECKVL